jgi:carbohydrate kinase (thermoresistant glucokinase family)
VCPSVARVSPNRQDKGPIINSLARLVASRNWRENGVQPLRSARIAVVMGVSGTGKTTVGSALAHFLGWRFQEGDALHPPENVAKMHAGIPLDDEDRAPWLRAVAARIDQWRERREAGIITCSALKRKYRDIIIGDRPEVRLVYLTAPPALIAERLAGRRGHFMPASLLESQLAALEPPGLDENALIVTVDAPVETIVERIAAVLTSLNSKSDTIG